MNKRLGRRVNDGDRTGLKQDRYRNSRFEQEDQSQDYYQGVTRRTANTIGGVYQENRGRRSADPSLVNEDNPFENGGLDNWGRRQGWDRFFYASYDKEGNRPHGGALMDHEGSHFGKGPKGYSRTDDRILEDVNETLYLSADVDASDIEATVKDGCVFLKGTVSDRRMKRMAELEVENISGVKDVQNFLTFDSEGRRGEDREQNTESRH